MKLTRPSIRSFAIAVTLAVLCVSHSYAGSHIWTGAGGNKFWNNAANWTGGAPIAGEAAPVTLIFTNGPICTNNIPGLTVDMLVLNGDGGIFHGSGGGTLTFRGAGGTNLFSTGAYGSNMVASTLPVTLAGSNYFRMHTFREIAIQSAISGTGHLTVTGGGFLNYIGSQANTYSGTTKILQAYFRLGKTAGVNAIAGPLILGDDDQATPDGWINLMASNQIADTAPVTVNILAAIHLKGFDETFGVITFKGGEIYTEDGLLTLSTNVVIEPSSIGSSIRGRLSLGGVNRTFMIPNGAGFSLWSQVVDGPSTAGIIKTGSGELSLLGTNTYTGATMVNEGSVWVKTSQSLGTVAGGTTVATNAYLLLNNNVIVGAEELTLNGTLSAGFSGNLAWNGWVNLGSTAVISVNDNTELTLNGKLTAGGRLLKTGGGALVLSGASANLYSGGTFVERGMIKLGKSGGAASIPGSLEIGGSGYPAVVQLLSPQQISDIATVKLYPNGTLDLNNQNETIGSLSGTGSVSLVTATLTTGGNNASTTFDGVIGGVGFSPLIKNGTGTFTLNGTNTCSGTTTVNAGKLVVNGMLPGLLTVNAAASLGGTGVVGHLTSASGSIQPGNSVGKITTGNLTLNNAIGSVSFELNGTTPGIGHDQIVVNGSVTLNNATLALTLSSYGAVGNKYVLIANDGSDSVTGTFNGLPEGSTVVSGLLQFTISYKGGAGSNDVVLTQTTIPTPSQIGQVTMSPDGQAYLTGSGVIGYTYDVEATASLESPGWTVIGKVVANWNGMIKFTDVDAPNFPKRFYRFRMQ